MARAVSRRSDRPLCCPMCGREIVATICGMKRPLSPQSEAALRAVIEAAHRKLAHGGDDA